MKTTERLAAALRDAGLEQMAERAAAGVYDDFISDLPLPCMVLCEELLAVGTPAAMDLRIRSTYRRTATTSQCSGDGRR